LVAPSAPQKNIGADIASILKSIKLPENRTEKPAQTIENQAPALGELPTLEPSATTPPPKVAAEEIPKVIVPPARGEQPASSSTPAPAASTPSQEQPSSVHSVHTMKNDLQDTVRERKISVVRAAAMEQERRPHE